MTPDNDDIEIFFEKDDGGCFIESLARSRRYLKDTPLLAKLDKLVSYEIDLAIMGAEKAKSEALKKNSKDNLRPIK